MTAAPRTTLLTQSDKNPALIEASYNTLRISKLYVVFFFACFVPFLLYVLLVRSNHPQRHHYFFFSSKRILIEFTIHLFIFSLSLCHIFNSEFIISPASIVHSVVKAFMHPHSLRSILVGPSVHPFNQSMQTVRRLELAEIDGRKTSFLRYDPYSFGARVLESSHDVAEENTFLDRGLPIFIIAPPSSSVASICILRHEWTLAIIT